VLLLFFRIVTAPLILGLASLVSRRWGAAVGGALAAIPLVAGSVSFFVSLDQGPEFGSRVATATLVGVGSLGWYSLAYAHASRRFGWPVSLACATAVVLAGSVAVIAFAEALGMAAFAYAITSLAVASRLLPPAAPAPRADPPAWDIPARMATAAFLVVGITGVAEVAGPQLSGLLAAFPLVFSALVVFTHRHEGAESARGLLRGFLVGLVATSLFLEIVADGIVPLGIGPAFVAAIAAFMAYQAVAISRLRRPMAAGAWCPQGDSNP
jgi:hypothetical protein